ncbi:MAG: RagB/SusD family nutrient uptake outer membrane protein, partial [Pedobacter sp.]
LSKEDMRQRIRKERMVELSFEEHRMWDVRRWKIIDKTDKLTTGMEWTKLANGTFTGKRIVSGKRNAWQEKYLLFPIPLTDISKLPMFKQNPGW